MYILKRMFCYWPIFLKIFVTNVSKVTESIPPIITLYRILCGTLKHTLVKFKLLTDIDKMFIERVIRDGLSQCFDRYAQ